MPASGGQTDVTEKALNQGRGLSPQGRVTTPYPLRDGRNRVLLSYRPCEVTRDGAVVPCSTMSADELSRLSDTNRAVDAVNANGLKDNVPASYAIYMFDPPPQTWLIVAAPPRGFTYTDPVALQARAEPIATAPTSIDAALAAQGLALIEGRSVYDTNGLERMGEGMPAAVGLPSGCLAGIAQTTPAVAMDTRSRVTDLAHGRVR